MAYARGFNVVQTAGLGDSSVRIRRMVYDSAATFKIGAVLVLATDGEVAEAGADPTAIIGVAAQGVATGPGYEFSHDSQVLVRTGVAAEISVYLAKGNFFSGRGVNGGTDPVTPVQTHIGGQYGIAKVDDHWVIDIAETSALVVEIDDIVPAQGSADAFFIFHFLDSVIAPAS